MATVARTISNNSGASSTSSNGLSLVSSSSPRGGGILANAHEAPKKPIKAPDNGFTSALKNAFIPPQPGKQSKKNGKPLGKSFERTSPLPTVGHEGGEVLKRDPRGQNAQVGDGIVLTSDSDGEDVDGESLPWSPVSDTSSLPASSSGEVQSFESVWNETAPRGRSSTTSTTSTASTRSTSGSSQCSSNNPCQIKFCPLPSSGRLKRANSITIGVAARSQLLQSQGAGRTYDNSAAWQGYQQPPQSSQQSGNPPAEVPKQAAAVRYSDTVDLGEELRKGVVKAWRRMRKGSNLSETSTGEEAGIAGRKDFEAVEEEDGLETGGEKTPKRSDSPTKMSSIHRDHLPEESDGTLTPRHSMQRRTSTGAFTGNKSLLEMEEKRKRGSRGEADGDREEVAQFAEALGRTHASRVVHHTGNESWHPGMNLRSDEKDKTKSVDETESDEVYDDADDDVEAVEAQRMADEALLSHSEKATKAGGVEKMERRK